MFLHSVFVLAPLLLTQFGLHMALLNAPLSYMGCDGVEAPGTDCIVDWQPSWATSAYALGGLIGSTLAGVFALKVGGAKLSSSYIVYRAAVGCFAIGASVLAIAKTQHVVVAARLLLGVGAGLSVNCCPILLDKLSPPGRKGLCGSLTQISINVGIIIAQFFGLLWGNEHQWRRIMYAAAVVAFLNVAVVVAGVFIGKPASEPANEHSSEHSEHSIGTPASGVSLLQFFTDARYRKTLVITVSIFFVQQATGINSIVQYGVSVLALALPDHAALASLFVMIINLLMTGVAAGLLDRCGRRPLLLASLAATGLSTAMLAFGLVRGLAGFSVIAVVLTVASFAVGTGPIPFLYVSHIASPESAALAQSVGTFVSWLSTFAVVGVFPALQRSMGPSAFYVFSVFSILSAVWYYFYLPPG